MIKRILSFDKQDCKHVTWLFRGIVKSFILFRYNDMMESYYLLKMHLNYDSKRKFIKEND